MLDTIKRFVITLINDFIECFVLFLRLVFLGRFANYNEIKRLKIKEHDNLCILGNGSSLKNVSFQEFASADFMVVNRHVLSEDYMIRKPRYYVLTDEHFFNHPEGLSIMKAIKERTSWEMYLFVPSYRGVNRICKLYSGTSYIHCIVFNGGFLSSMETINKLIYMHNLATPPLSNVMVGATTISAFLGYNTVYLYGVEHSWMKYLFVNDKNEACLYNAHFYDKDEVPAKTMSEIQHQEMTIGDALHMYARMFDSYQIVKKIAQWNNVHIVNKTKNSYIDAFDRG